MREAGKLSFSFEFFLVGNNNFYIGTFETGIDADTGGIVTREELIAYGCQFASYDWYVDTFDSIQQVTFAVPNDKIDLHG